MQFGLNAGVDIVLPALREDFLRELPLNQWVTTGDGNTTTGFLILTQQINIAI